MKTLEHIKVGNEQYDISVADAGLCAITLKGVQYIVPYPIAKLISDLAEQIGKEQERRRKDDDEILEFIKKQSVHIAYALSGGDKNSVAYYGENLLKHSLGEKVPLPAGVEFDDGSTTEEFYSVVSGRIRTAIETARDMRGRMMEKLNGSEPADPSMFR